MSFEEQSCQNIPTHFSRILVDLQWYLQKLNLNRIIDGLEAENMFSLPVSQGLKKIDDLYEQSDIISEILRHKEEKDFKLFLKIIASEKKVGKFYDATKQFFSHFTEFFPGYEEYALWPNEKVSTYDITQMESKAFTVGRDGIVNYDPVHGSSLHVAEDSLPDGIDEVTITRRHGLNPCKLHSSMQLCSAIVYFETEPMIEFTKDVHIEIPHCFSSVNTQELCFVKYDHFMDYTGFGEIHLGGIFPADYPYGVISTKTFSAYSISTKKQWRMKALGRKARVRKLQSQLLHKKFKSLNINKKRQPSNHTHDGVPNGYWLGVKESTDKRTISFLLSQCTPTGYKTLQQAKEGCLRVLSKLHFQSDELMFHPQTAEDCNWKIFAADQKYQISKDEIDNYAQVTYHLVLTKLHSSVSTNLCIPISLTGGDIKFIHVISQANPDATVSIVDEELLHKLYAVSVKPDVFLQQLACKLPFWQPVARLLGLSEVDMKEIEADYPKGQREDGSFLPVYKGEQAYQALLKWMQSKGSDATYGELLVALYNTLLSNDNITDAWWYAYNELTGSQFIV